MLDGLLLGWMVHTIRIPPVLPSGQLADKMAALVEAMLLLVQDGTKARRASCLAASKGVSDGNGEYHSNVCFTMGVIKASAPSREEQAQKQDSPQGRAHGNLKYGGLRDRDHDDWQLIEWV
jgi:hypothetical protein